MASARPSCSMRAAVMLLASAELALAERRALRGLARASNASDRRLQSCGSATFVAAPEYCGNYDSRQCYDNVPCGETCEGDGECGTDPGLDNCAGDYDVYRKDCSSSGSSSDDNDDNDGREDDTGMFVGIFCAFALAAAWGFHVYRKKKIKRSRGLKKELKGVKTELKRMNSELNTYKNAAVGMRVAVTAAGPTAPAPGPVMWYWQESPATPRRTDGTDGAFASTAQVDEPRGLAHTGAVRATPGRERTPLDPLRRRYDEFVGVQLPRRPGTGEIVRSLRSRHESYDAEERADGLRAPAPPLRATGVQRSRAAAQAPWYRRRRAVPRS